MVQRWWRYDRSTNSFASGLKSGNLFDVWSWDRNSWGNLQPIFRINLVSLSVSSSLKSFSLFSNKFNTLFQSKYRSFTFSPDYQTPKGSNNGQLGHNSWRTFNIIKFARHTSFFQFGEYYFWKWLIEALPCG
jgi:hypothetical protein